MDAATNSMPAFQNRGAPGPLRGSLLRRYGWRPGWLYFLCIAITILLCATDVVLPRGETVAIGYCLVPLIAAGTRRRSFLFGMAILCTCLTWIAVYFEPAGESFSRSLFDRAMVTAVIWIALIFVLRRATMIRILMRQTQALKRTTRELKRSNGELANFASVVAHDLRGPLNTIGLYAHLLCNASPIKDSAEQLEWINSIQGEIARMSGFIQSLLAYGRVESGDLNLETCDTAEVLKEVRQNLKADLEANHVELSVDPLPALRVDPVFISQLFQNLIENSIKYRGEAPPHIHISAVHADAAWRFLVEDNGVGIRPEDCERIFKPFCQTNAAKSRGKGVGLGLATCRRIVERHGGHMEARPNPAGGATFFFTIPGASA